MIDQDGPGAAPPTEEEKKSEEAPPPKRRPRLVTDAMRAANRANSAHSTGPKSACGKAAVSVNAVKHGCSCKELIFLDDEDPAEFWADVERRVKQRGVTTDEERDLIVTIVYSRWTKRRAINAQATAINEARAQIRDRFADRSVKETRELIPKLATEPAVAVEELSNSTRGCEFLIGQFQALDARLSAFYSTEVSQRGQALRIGGHRPDELFTDPDVFDFNKAYFGAISGPGSFTADGAANALQFDMPATMSYTEFTRRLEPLVADLPTLEEGHRRLKAYVEEELIRLKQRKELVGYREGRKVKAAFDMAQSAIDRAGVTWERYIGASDRTFNAALRLLLAIKEERRKHGDEDEDPADESQAPEATFFPAAEAPPAAVGPAETAQAQNKAVAPQVAGPVASNNPASAPRTLIRTAPAVADDDPLLALIEKGLTAGA
jgi:hypothetical protein